MRLARAGTSRDSSDPWASTWAQELVLGSVGDVVAERLGEELVGGGEVLLAVPEQHAGPGVEGGPGRLGHERGLAQTGLARDEQDLAAFARGDPLGGVGRWSASRSPGRPRPRPGARPDGRAEGWRLESRPRRGAPRAPRRSRRDRADPSGSVPRGVGTRDGCADRPWPEPRRRPGSARSRRWHTAGPPRRPGPRSSRRPPWLTSPAAQSDPQSHRVLPAPVVPFDALLHGHGTGQGGRRRAEDHHEPVAEVLHLGATGLGDGLAQDREVLPADLVGGLGRQALATAPSSPPCP